MGSGTASRHASVQIHSECNSALTPALSAGDYSRQHARRSDFHPLAARRWLSASNYRDVQRAVNDDQLLASAGVEPANAELRKQCSAAVVETDDPPEFFDCVYVQTDKT